MQRRALALIYAPSRIDGRADSVKPLSPLGGVTLFRHVATNLEGCEAVQAVCAVVEEEEVALHAREAGIKHVMVLHGNTGEVRRKEGAKGVACENKGPVCCT